MSNLNDIFDLPEGTAPTQQTKKERKKPEMSDEKKQAMLERLAKGRETRANNLLLKKGGEPKTEKQPSDIKVEEKKKITEEEEKMSFLNMLKRDKNEPSKKYERPKKKVYEEQPKVEPKVEPKIEAPKVEQPKIIKVEAPKVEAPKVVKPIAPPTPIITKPPAPIVISLFKRPIWG